MILFPVHNTAAAAGRERAENECIHVWWKVITITNILPFVVR